MFVKRGVDKKSNFKPLAMVIATGGLLASSFFISACGSEFNSKKLSDVQTNSPKGRNTGKVEASTDTGTPELKITGQAPYQYQAQVTWPEVLRKVRIYSNGSLAFKSLSENINNCFFDLEHNKEYKIRLYAAPTKTQEVASPVPTPIGTGGEDESQLVQEWEIKTPLDIELTPFTIPFGFNMPLDLKANRIFLRQEIPVVTNGYYLKLDTEEFIVLKDGKVSNSGMDSQSSSSQIVEDTDAAKIITFTKEKINDHVGRDLAGRPISFWSDGKDGGKIIIKAKRATGNLKVYLRGQNGADGHNGEAYTERAPQGPQGDLAEYNMFQCLSGSFPRKICMCIKNKERENGGQGAKGNPGRDGSNGGRGGDSGSIRIEVAEPNSNFKIWTITEPGVAGTPGKAGPPQQGGLGGPPVDKKHPFIDYICDETHQGPEGPLGDPGHDGVRQRDGIQEQNCVSIGEGFGRCAN